MTEHGVVSRNKLTVSLLNEAGDQCERVDIRDVFDFFRQRYHAAFDAAWRAAASLDPRFRTVHPNLRLGIRGVMSDEVQSDHGFRKLLWMDLREFEQLILERLMKVGCLDAYQEYLESLEPPDEAEYQEAMAEHFEHLKATT